MHKHDVKRGVVVLVVFLILINLSLFIHAFGITAPYLENNTLMLNPGSDYKYILTIQNGDIEDYYVDIEYSSTNNIVSMKQKEYFVRLNTYDTTAYFTIQIPANANIGEEYILQYSAKPRLSNTSIMEPIQNIEGLVKIIVVGDSNIITTKSEVVSEEIETQEPTEQTKIPSDSGEDNSEKYFIIIVIIILLILISIKLWKISKKIRISGNEKVTNYTISEAINLKEVQELLEKITDDEFRLPEIKNLFKEKISELTSHNISKDIKTMSRRETIQAIEKIR